MSIRNFAVSVIVLLTFLTTSTLPVFVSQEVQASITSTSNANNTYIRMFIDGRWYTAIYNQDGKMIDLIQDEE